MKNNHNFKTIGSQVERLRTQLGMPLEALSFRTNIGVDTLKQIESNSLAPDLGQLNTIASALVADATIELVPKKPIPQIVADQARIRSKEIVRYVQGTMSLEAQEPDREFLDSLVESKIKELLTTKQHLIWESN